jgi:spermidine synthase
MNEFINTELIIEKDKIYYIDYEGNEQQVMMRWETPLMQHHVDILSIEGGDILEIGFGMGISADMIMERNPASYTVVEIHPQIISLAKEWAKDKPNVTIIEGNWLDVLGEIGKKRYDGILFDTYADLHQPIFASVLVNRFIKPNGIFTYWGPDGHDSFRYGKNYINPNYQEVPMVIPEECSYISLVSRDKSKREVKQVAVPFVQYKDGQPLQYKPETI